MSRLILLVFLIAALAAAAMLVATAFGRRTEAGLPAPQRRVGAVQKVAYALLFVVMAGVGSGWLGAE